MPFRMCTKLSKIKRKHFLLNCVLADWNWSDWNTVGCGVLVVIALLIFMLCVFLAYRLKLNVSKSNKGRFLSQCTLMWCVCVCFLELS